MVGSLLESVMPRGKHVAYVVLGCVLTFDFLIFRWLRSSAESDEAPVGDKRRLLRWGLGQKASGDDASVDSLVTIFSVECSTYHDWQSVVLYESWKAAKVPGRLVRILACSNAQRRQYKRLDTLGDRMETHVHRKGVPPGLNYSPLNKPYGVISWLAEGSGAKLSDSSAILIVDPDMSFRGHRARQDLATLTSRISSLENTALGLDYKYVTGGMEAMNWKIPLYFNASTDVNGLQSVGTPIMIRKDNLQRLARGWYDYTLRIVTNKTTWGLVHDGDNYAPWIAEMYGYTLAAAGWLQHETQVAWPELEAPQPPFASTGGEYLPDPLVTHYSHPFVLCGKRFGKNMWTQIDPLQCDAPDKLVEMLRPPSAEELNSPSCKLCIDGGDVIGFRARCFGNSPRESYIKKISWQAWARVAKGIFTWRSKHCFQKDADSDTARSVGFQADVS